MGSADPLSEIYALDLDWDFIQHLAIPESVEIIKAEVHSELLEDSLAVEVYQWQLDHIHEHGKPATGTVLEAEFESVTIKEPQTAIDDLIRRLRERYGRNEGRKSIITITKSSLNDPVEIAHEMMKEGQRLSKLLTARKDTFDHNSTEKAIQLYHKKVTRGRGPSLGFKELDEHFYGQLGLTFMIGPPKGGKSWFTVKAFQENIMEDRRPYLFSLELPAKETDFRLRCMAAHLPYWKYLQDQLDPQELQAVNESSEILKERGGPFIIEKPVQGKRDVVSMVSRARDAGAGVIFIDQLQYIENRRGVAVGATNDTKDYFEVINDLRDLSDDGPIWCVHQFNRSIMNAEAMPDMQQVKGSSAVEECGTLVLGLWANKEMRKSNIIQLGTLASRNYGHVSWECQMKMRTTCGIEILGRSADN